MAISKKQQASVSKYVKEHYDRISVLVPQGKREEIKTHAEAHNETINKFINRAVDETIQRDNDN